MHQLGFSSVSLFLFCVVFSVCFVFMKFFSIKLKFVCFDCESVLVCRSL